MISFSTSSVSPFHPISTGKSFQAHATPFNGFPLHSRKSTGSLTGLDCVLNPGASACSVTSYCAYLSHTHVFCLFEEAVLFFSFSLFLSHAIPILGTVLHCLFHSIIPVSSLFGYHLFMKAFPNYPCHRQDWCYPCFLMGPWDSLLQNFYYSLAICFWNISPLFDFRVHGNKGHVCPLYHCILIAWRSA